jgi:Cu2+-exporting ATPase
MINSQVAPVDPDPLRCGLPSTHAALDCFHCGLPVPPNIHFTVVINGQPRPMCCHGCEAVAEAIVAAGLTNFYQHRTVNSKRPEDLIPEQLRGLELYDRADLQKSFRPG